MSSWPDSRPIDYDPDLWWDEDSETWGTGYIQGPGSRAQHLVVVGHDGDGNGVVYFGTE